MPRMTVSFQWFDRAVSAIFGIADKHLCGVINEHIRTLALGIIALCSTVVLEILSNSRSSPFQYNTLLKYFQASVTSEPYFYTTLICGGISVLYFIQLIYVPVYGMVIMYTYLVKFIEIIPPLVDLIDLLFIYQHTMFSVYSEQKQNDSMQLIYPSIPLCLSLLLAMGRVLLAIRFIRQKTIDESNSKSTVMIYDILLLILITSLGYSPRYPLRIVRKLVLVFLFFKLNDISKDRVFWLALINMGVKACKNKTLGEVLQTILSFVTTLLKIELPKRQNAYWILVSRLMICYSMVWMLYVHSLDLPKVNNLHVELTARTVIYLFLQPDFLIPSISVFLMGLLGWDAIQCCRELEQYGIVWFCTGLESLANWESDIQSGGKRHAFPTLREQKPIGTFNTDHSRVLNSAVERFPSTAVVTTIANTLNDQSDPITVSQPTIANVNNDNVLQSTS